MRELLGLDMPIRIAPTTPDGKEAYIPAAVLRDMPLEELAVLHRLHMRAQLALAGPQAANGHANGNGATNGHAAKDGCTDSGKFLAQQLASAAENAPFTGEPRVDDLLTIDVKSAEWQPSDEAAG